MLKNYDETQTYCSLYDEQTYNCIGEQEDFPAALHHFLTKNSYLQAEADK
jgi:hypothetical protein